jgi:predicted nucleotidyltransferase
MSQRALVFLPEQDRRALEAFVEHVRQTYPNRVHVITLFGSKARGDSHAYSDIDVLLIVDKEDWRFRHAISGIAADVSLAYNVLIGPRIISRERWARMRRYRFTFYKNVQADGIDLTPDLNPHNQNQGGKFVRNT